MSMSMPMLNYLVLLMLLLYYYYLCPTVAIPIASGGGGGGAGGGGGDLRSDALALLHFKSNLTSDGSSLSSWTFPSASSSLARVVCSSWAGIGCSGEVKGSGSGRGRRVSWVRLPGKSLVGPIPASTLGMLDSLHTLSLRSNSLHGPLPSDLANLSSLRKLYLQQNNLSGNLPSNFSAFPLLSQLDLSFNAFDGTIPPSLGALPHLRSLRLQNNALQGPIPPTFNMAKSLQVLNASNNHLNGSIPSSLANFSTSAFVGNLNLCGPPLSPCTTTTTTTTTTSTTTTLPVIVESPDHTHHRKKLSTIIITGIICGSTLAFVLLLSLCLLCYFAKSTPKKGVRGGSHEAGGAAASRAISGEERAKRRRESSSCESLGNGGAMPKDGASGEEEKMKLIFIEEHQKLFGLEDLLRASAEVLGKGSLGTAYKAVLEDGLIVAVKRLRDVEDGRKAEYHQHIEMMGRLKHENLVPLRAYYFDKEENLLVYDFMQNGSLLPLLHGSRGAGYNITLLDWEARVRIALTAGRGLAFLHAHNFVHGNIKSSNVLLKSNLEACLADYGLVQMVALTPTLASQRMCSGYTAPEVTDPRRVTDPADVYSFGVLLLELLTGKMPLSSAGSSVPTPPIQGNPPLGTGAVELVHADNGGSLGVCDLPRWVQSVVREEWTAEVFDPHLLLLVEHSSASVASIAAQQEEMLQLLQIAMPCVLPSPHQRPSMSHVLRMIENLRRPMTTTTTTDDDKSSGS